MRGALLAAVSAAWIGAGCEAPPSPTSPSDLIVLQLTTELFTGTLPAKGSRFYSYTVTEPGTVSMTLASLTIGGVRPVTSRVGLGIGIPAGTGCGLQASAAATPALVSQLQHSVTPGIYCVSLSDIDGLSQDLGFAIRIVHP